MGKIWRTYDRMTGIRYTLKLINTIYSYMQDKKITFAEIARRMAISRASVSQMFSGSVVWSLATLIKVCDVLDLDFELVLTPRKLKL